MNEAQRRLAYALYDLEPTITHTIAGEESPVGIDWHNWRKACEWNAAFVAKDNQAVHAEFMEACGL